MKRLRLRKIIAKIKKNPEIWNQDAWHCRTAHCIAGHCQIEAGKYNPEKDMPSLFSSEDTKKDATEYLNIDSYQTEYLFSCFRTLKEIIKFEKTNGQIPKNW